MGQEPTLFQRTRDAVLASPGYELRLEYAETVAYAVKMAALHGRRYRVRAWRSPSERQVAWHWGATPYSHLSARALAAEGCTTCGMTGSVGIHCYDNYHKRERGWTT